MKEFFKSELWKDIKFIGLMILLLAFIVLIVMLGANEL